MTLPLNTLIPHDGSTTCPVHPETIVEVDDWRGKHWARSLNWKGVTTYTIIARAPADEIAALQARVTELKGALAATVAAYDRSNPVRMADQHRDICECLRCATDNARAALKGSPNAHD